MSTSSASLPRCFHQPAHGRYKQYPLSGVEPRESDLARLRDVKNAEDFVRALDRVCEASLTTDYWNITLPNDLATSSPRSPSLFAYFAALVLLEARVLFSDQKVVDALEPSIHANRAAAERHHLFPKNYLKTLGDTESATTNLIANFALVDWGDKREDCRPSTAGRVAPGLSGEISAPTFWPRCTTGTPYPTVGSRWTIRTSWSRGGSAWRR